MNSASMRSLVENEKYTRDIKALGDYERIDHAVLGTLCAISRDPTQFPVVIPGKEDIRLAKTIQIGVIPRLRILFRIQDANSVELLSIEAAPIIEGQ